MIDPESFVPTPQISNNSRTASSFPGGSVGVTQTPAGQDRQAQTQNQTALDLSNISDAAGRRVRLRPKPGAVAQVYGDSGYILSSVLGKTNGMIWPYQPTITYTQSVDYQNIDLVHVNQELFSYQRTKALQLTVDGQFTVQSHEEGLYAMACIRFLQTVTKMYFGGEQGSTVSGLQGTPPPVLLFDAYGQYMFNCLPVIVTTFTVGLPADVDYVPINFGQSFPIRELPQQVGRVTQNSLDGRMDNTAWLPALFNISVSLTVQNTPKKLRQFNLDKFRTGELVKNGGWI